MQPYDTQNRGRPDYEGRTVPGDGMSERAFGSLLGEFFDQARRLKDLEKENGRLKRLLAEAELDKAILREAAAGKY